MNNLFAKIFLLVIVVFVGGAAYYVGANYHRNPDVIPLSTAATTVAPSISPKPQLIGGDKDAHGCLAGAGYTWCGEKNKCIRVFEQDCLSEVGIKTAFATKYNKKVSDIYLKISGENPTYAKGSVSFDSPTGEGGMFLATKVGSTWKLVFDGNGAVDCQKIKQTYDFPPEMLTNFCD